MSIDEKTKRLLESLKDQGNTVLEPIPVEGAAVLTTNQPTTANIYDDTPTDQSLKFEWKQPQLSQQHAGFETGAKYGYSASNTSFSGCDIKAIGNARGQLKVFAEIQTLSYSIHREKMPVRTLGRTYPKGYTRGPRTIAGSLVFTIFDRQALWQLVQLYRADKGLGPEAIKTPLVDQLPPFDITITFDNEYGNHSYLRLYGIDIIDEGQSHSIDDMITENVMSYVARDIDMMVPADVGHWGKQGKIFYNSGYFFSNKMGEAQMSTYRQLMDDISTLQQTAADTSATDAERASAQRQITILNQKIKQVQGGEMMIRRASINDNAHAYNIPWDTSTWNPTNIRGYDSSLSPPEDT